MPHSQSQRHLLIVHLFRSYTLVFEFPLRARHLNWVYDLWKGLIKHKAQVTKQFEWKFLCGDHYKLMCGIRTLSWVWKSKASSSASYFDIRGMRVNMCFENKTYKIYEIVKIHERSLSYFRAALFCLYFKTSPGALPHGNDFDLQDRQWTLKEHLFQYGKLWIKTCFETEVLKSKNNSKMTRWLKIIFALSSEQRFDTVELDLLSEVRGKDCWTAAVLWYKLHFYFVLSDFFLNFM